MKILLRFAALMMPFFAVPSFSPNSYGGGLSNSSDCIPEGECRDECFDRPPLPPGAGRWAGNEGNPFAWDDDFLFDDPVGSGEPQGDDGGSACVEICNVGGELVGPNGEDLGLPGCIELYMCWEYEVWVEVHAGFSYGTGGRFKARAGTWVTKTICVPPRSVCPC